MRKLSSFEKKYLRGLAHGLNPVVLVGQKGATATLLQSVEEALEAHELIKIRFVELKERDLKQRLTESIASQTRCQVVGTIGHTAILFRSNLDPEKQKIALPK